MRNAISTLQKHQPFCFDCSPQVPCFNACCRDLNQVLSPYDVLQLRQFLKMDSSAFLDAYTQQSTGPGSGMPVVSLRFQDADDLACPFVSASGCRVYAARPASCRTYPLARGVSRNRQTGILTEQWAVIREPHCKGFEQGRPQTIDAWIADQQIDTYNRMNDMLLDLISRKHRCRPGPLRPAEFRQVYTALYDLDRFRCDLMATDSPAAGTVDAICQDRARTGDLELLIVAMQWIGTHIFSLSTQGTGP